MGFSYARVTGKNGKVKSVLACDTCGKPGARKVHCPFNFCPSVAVCSKCKKLNKEKYSEEHHREMGCEASSDRLKFRDSFEVLLEGKGFLIGTSAMICKVDGESVIQYTFRNKTFNIEQGIYLPKELDIGLNLYDIVCTKDGECFGVRFDQNFEAKFITLDISKSKNALATFY